MFAYPSAPSIDIPQEVLDGMRGASGVAWIGINSFEERCLASIVRLFNAGVPVKAIYLLDYPTVATPEAEDRRIRKSNREVVFSLAQKAGCAFHNASIEAYSSPGLEAWFREFLSSPDCDARVVDITCFTKIHVISLANILSMRDAASMSTLVAYTSPRGYGNLDRNSKRIGWSDVIIAPIAATAFMRNEGHGRGIVIAGHESERLWSALTEIEPASGLLVFGSAPKRPDITRLSEKINKAILEHMALDYAHAWRKEVVEITDFAKLNGLLQMEVETARSANAPVILYPFGPKSLTLFAARYLVQHYAEGSWFVYPVAAGYDVSYSDGIAGTHWFAE